MMDSALPALEERSTYLRELQEWAQKAIQQAQDMTRKYHERKKGQHHFWPFTEGQMVLLEGTNLSLPYPTKKLRPKHFGPFRIIKVVSPYVYKLDLPPQWKIHNVFHASLLTPYSETAEHGQNHTEPPPDLVDDHQEYEVEEILGSRRRYRKLQYLLKWKGYSAAHNIWEPVENVNSPELIREFHEANPEAMRTLEVEGDINPPLDPLPSPFPSPMDFSPIWDFILNLDLASVDIPDDVYTTLLLTGLTPEDFQPKRLDIDSEYASSPPPLPVPDPATRAHTPILPLRAPQPTQPFTYGEWSPKPADDDYPSSVAPPDMEEEPPSLAIDAFHRIDEWRAQLALYLATAG
jgi:Chromo (CHRromatin Organisation MOdifier) domain